MPKKKLKKFCVTLYYHSYVRREVEAADEGEALDKARSEVSDDDVCASIIEEGNEVEEDK